MIETDAVFKALADPSRRLLLDRLYERNGQTLSELKQHVAMSRFGVMKHLRVLEEAGLITTEKVSREKIHYLNPVPIQLISDRWIGRFAARASALADLRTILEGVSTMANERARPAKQVYEVYIRAPRARVWEAITRPEFTSRYFYGGHVNSTLTPQSRMDYFLADGTQLVEGQVVESDPPRRLVHTWKALWDPDVAVDAPSRVTWELEESSHAVTRLRVIHDDFEGETSTYKQISGGWTWVLSNLKTLLETGDTLPEPTRAQQ